MPTFACASMLAGALICSRHRQIHELQPLLCLVCRTWCVCIGIVVAAVTFKQYSSMSLALCALLLAWLLHAAVLLLATRVQVKPCLFGSTQSKSHRHCIGYCRACAGVRGTPVSGCCWCATGCSCRACTPVSGCCWCCHWVQGMHACGRGTRVRCWS